MKEKHHTEFAITLERVRNWQITTKNHDQTSTMLCNNYRK